MMKTLKGIICLLSGHDVDPEIEEIKVHCKRCDKWVAALVVKGGSDE